MANRRFNQFGLSLEGRLVNIYLRATIGATGAPTLVAAKSKGIASIARTGAGAYDITLSDQYVDLFAALPTILFASGSPVSGAMMVVRSQDVAATKVIQVEFLNGSFAAAELASGVQLGIKFELKDSTV
jgi:hypothetical protein